MRERYIAVPDSARKKINRAAKFLTEHERSDEGYAEALELVRQWRAAHIYPMNTFIVTLRRYAEGFEESFTAQRLKRLPTILHKLKRHPHMQLTTMQDIAGVRAVLKTVGDVYRLATIYDEPGRLTHELKYPFDSAYPYDYIAKPKKDGYRGMHLVYKYKNTRAPESRATEYEGLLVEVQLRTHLQHAWSTAVETVGFARKDGFKYGNGDKDWHEFFALVSSFIAWVEETRPLERHAHLSLREIGEHMKQLDRKKNILSSIEGYNQSIRYQEEVTAKHYYSVITLDLLEHKGFVKSFGRHESDLANKYLDEQEQKYSEDRYDIVLLSAGKTKELKRAYPNYFFDVKKFIELVKDFYQDL